MTRLSDSFHRPINYLRISVTDRCNLRCVYCMPAEGIQLLSHNDILSYEEINRVAKAAAELGIDKVRLTGGEPLVRSNVSSLISMLAGIEGIKDISLTTNGVLLEQNAHALKEAGLKRVNISLDSLNVDRYNTITRFGRLDDVLRGINAAHKEGLNPIKINVVVIGGINDDEVLDFARLTIEKGWHVRFIEYMRFNEANEKFKLIPISEIKKRVEVLGKLESVVPEGGGPAKYYRFRGAAGTVGFIGPVTEHFCKDCNRLRLTAGGKLRPCLFSEDEVDLREPLRQGASDDDLKLLIREAVLCKPAGHELESGITCDRVMSQIGG